MSRRSARELALHIIYAGEYSEKTPTEVVEYCLSTEHFASLEGEYKLYNSSPEENQLEYIKKAAQGVLEHGPELDSYIERYTVGWNVSRISRMAKCIMRLSMFEMMYMQIPVGASVNEALEFAKIYDSEEAATFINGILASFIKKELTA